MGNSEPQKSFLRAVTLEEFVPEDHPLSWNLRKRYFTDASVTIFRRRKGFITTLLGPTRATRARACARIRA